MAGLWVPILEATDRWLLLCGPSRESLRTANETSPAATAVNPIHGIRDAKANNLLFRGLLAHLWHI